MKIKRLTIKNIGIISDLATIVGEKPATIPENICVFVIENGKKKGAK